MSSLKKIKKASKYADCKNSGKGSLLKYYGVKTERRVVIIIPAAFLLGRAFGPAGVWNAFWIAEAVTGVISVFIYRRVVRNH